MPLVNRKLVETSKVVVGYGAMALGGSGEDFVTLKNASSLTVILAFANATTVTGGAITFLQSTVVAGSDEKTLAFPALWHSNVDTGATDTMVAQTGTSLTSDATNSKNLLYIFEWNAEDFDIDAGFDCFRCDIVGTTASEVFALYILNGVKYGGAAADMASAIID